MRPQIRFKEFTDDWEEKKLGEVSEITSSKRVFQQEWTNEGIPFYRARDLVSLQKNQILPDPLYISLETYLNKIKVSGEINKDDILVTGVGSLGVPYLVKSNDKFYFKDGNILWIKNIVSDSFYTYYYFLTSKVQRHIKIEAAGSTVGTFTIQTAKQLKFKFPSIPEQEKIGRFFSLLDQRIEKQERKVALLEERKKGWMQKIFNQEIRFKGNYPDWEEKKLGDIAQFFSGGTPKSTNKKYYMGDIPFIRSGEINETETELFINELALKNSSAKIVKKGDILYAMYGATAGNVSISKINGAINQAILCIRTSENNFYIQQYLMKNKEIYLNIYLQGGQGNLSANIIKNFKIQLPVLVEQEKIASFLSAQDELIEKEKEKLNLMKQEKKGFMQRMFV